MDKMKWSAEYSVGVAKIDEQHQEMFDLLNELQDALGRGWNQDKIREIFDLLEEHTLTHFAEEEKLMSLFNYPHQDSHALQHKDLIEELNYLKGQWARGVLKITPETTAYIQNWLNLHVEGPDQKLGKFLRSQGVV